MSNASLEKLLGRPLTDLERAAVDEQARTIERQNASHTIWLENLSGRERAAMGFSSRAASGSGYRRMERDRTSDEGSV